MKTTAIALFNVTERALSEIEKYKELVITDAKSEKDVRKCRQNTKALQVKVEKKRLANNRDFKANNNKVAGEIQSRLNPVYENLDEKIKVVEKEKTEKKAEKLKIEQERLKFINLSLDTVSSMAKAGTEYGLSSLTIEMYLKLLKEDELEEVEFQEFLETAEKIQQEGIENTQKALDARLLFEVDQRKLEKERKRIAEEDRKQKAARAKQADEEQKIREKAAKELQDQKEKFEAEQKTFAEEKAKLEKEKAEIERRRLVEVEEIAERNRYIADLVDAHAFNDQLNAGQARAKDIDMRLYADAWDEAHEFNLIVDYGIELAAKIQEQHEKNLKEDVFSMMRFVAQLDEIPLFCKTKAGKKLTDQALEKLYQLQEWIINEAEKLK